MKGLRLGICLSTMGLIWGCSLGPVEDLPIVGGGPPPMSSEDGEANGDDGAGPSPEFPDDSEVEAGAGGASPVEPSVGGSWASGGAPGETGGA